MDGTVEREKSTFRKKLTGFVKQHPKFRKYMDIVGDFISKLYLLYWIMVILIIIIPVFILYLSLPVEIRNAASGIFGGILSLFVIPLALNYINKRTENSIRIFEKNEPLYYKLTNILVDLLTTHNKNFRGNRRRLEQFLCENYTDISISFSNSLIWNIVYVYNECNSENNIDNIKYYTLKCLREIRKQAGLKKDFYLNGSILEMISKEREKEDGI